MLITIKPHSSFSKFFSEKEYTADFKTYFDILFYLNSMHKRFINYIRQQKFQGIEESFIFLDKNLRSITPEELQIKHVRKGDVIHIVPAVFGGGGKRGSLLAAFAVIALAIALPPLGAQLGAGAAAAGTAVPVIGTTGTVAGFGAKLTAALPGFLKQVATHIGLALLTSMFASKPKEEQTRQSDMFGSLVNSTSSGTPIALNYGMIRVAGQMVNGYVLSLGHGKTQHMNIYGEIIGAEYTAPVEQEVFRDEFEAGFNSK